MGNRPQGLIRKEEEEEEIRENMMLNWSNRVL
jgi:hypothetical protein